MKFQYSQIEVCAVNINTNPSIHVKDVGNYCPTSANVAEFCYFLRVSILSTCSVNHLVVFGGDFNIDLGDDHASHMLCDIKHSQSYFSLINRPTHITENTSTIIVNFWTDWFSTTQSSKLWHHISLYYLYKLFLFLDSTGINWRLWTILQSWLCKHIIVLLHGTILPR